MKRVICKIWTRTLENSADPDQTPRNAASDLGLHFLLKLQEVKGLNETILSPRSGPFSRFTFRDNRPTSAVSALIIDLFNPVSLQTIRCAASEGPD